MGSRIVSLLPGATEIVCALGLEAQLVGVSHECDFPPQVANLPKVTGDLFPPGATSAQIDALVRERMNHERALYTLNHEQLHALQPDLLVTQTLCDVCAVAESDVRAAVCTLPHQAALVNLEPQDLTGILDSIRQVARAAGQQPAGEQLVSRLNQRIKAVSRRSQTVEQPPRVLFLEWLQPPFSAGHWNPELVALAGGREVLGKAGKHSRTLQWEEITRSGAEVIFIACCGFGVGRSLRDLGAMNEIPGWRDLPAVRNGRIYLADGSHYFSRTGPRLVDSLEILAHALHPHLHPLPAGLKPAVRLNHFRGGER